MTALLAIIFLGSPSAILAPKFITISLSTIDNKACTICSIQTIAIPVSLILLIVLIKDWHSLSVNPPAISSNNKIFGLAHSALANSSLFLSSNVKEFAK